MMVAEETGIALLKELPTAGVLLFIVLYGIRQMRAVVTTMTDHLMENTRMLGAVAEVLRQYRPVADLRELEVIKRSDDGNK